MSLLFSISEGIKSMAKARMASVLSISSITLTIFLIGIFALFSLNLHNWISQVRQKIEMEVFIDLNAIEKNISDLKKKILDEEGVDSLKYISKAQASERFQREFGEDVESILEFNPFPASFTLYPTEAFRTAAGASRLQIRLEKFEYVDEVVYQKPLLLIIDKYVNIIYIILVFATIAIVAIAVTLINNTIRLTIYARRDIIQIMRLVGATEGFIRRPFIVEGVIQGVLGSVLASILIYYLLKLIMALFLPTLAYDVRIFTALIIFGFFIGMVSSYIAVGKYLKNQYF